MIISQGLGRVLETSDPVLASYVDPFGADQRVRAIANDLREDASAEELSDAAEQARRALVFNPVDPRLFSILGEVRARQGDQQGALSEFELARSLSKTEQLSVQRLIAASLQRGDIALAMTDIDTLLRRWPQRFDALAPFFVPVLSDQRGYDAVLASLQNGAPWRVRLVHYLAQQAEGVGLAEQLLGDLAANGTSVAPGEISAVITGRLRRGQYELAHRFFLFTLSPEEQGLAGYVFNSTFKPIRLQRYFDWHYPRVAGVDVQNIVGETAASAGGAQIRFLNTPIKDTGLGQILLLPPGDYELAVQASATGLILPKGLFWSLSCGERGKGIGRLDLTEGSYRGRAFGLKFTVPETGCEVQYLRLVTDLVAESWRFRYQGEITMHSVRLEKVAA